MKKRFLFALLLLTAALTVGITAAYMLRQTNSVTNQFEPAKVSCAVEEEFDSNTGLKSSIKVKNTSNIDCYLRVRLVSYWVDGEGNIVGKSSVIPSISVGTDWIADENNATYYYKNPVGVGMTTETNLLKEPLQLEKGEFNGETVYQVVEVFAEAIQSEPWKDGPDVWPGFSIAEKPDTY